MAKASTVKEYIEQLPAERRTDAEKLLQLIRQHMPAGYTETMTWGMPTWEIPLEMYPETYNKKPLMYVALASQKHHFSLYMTAPYVIPGELEKFEQAYRDSGKKLDMGKSCIRFKKLADLPLEVIAEAVARVTPQEYIKAYEAVHK